MNTIAKPYKVHPFAEMAAQKCPWLDDVRRRVKARIAEFEKLIADQSEQDGQPEMADDKHLYDSFKYNVDHNQYYGNLNVLKYFTWKFKVKILYEMIGEWKFTDQDVEMYNYFRTTDFSNVQASKFLRKVNRDAKSPSMFVHDNTCKWMLKLEGKLEFYSNLFYKELVLLDDMLRNIRGSRIIYPDEMFFTCGKLHEGLNVPSGIDYGDFETRVFSKE